MQLNLVMTVADSRVLILLKTLSSCGHWCLCLCFCHALY